MVYGACTVNAGFLFSALHLLLLHTQPLGIDKHVGHCAEAAGMGLWCMVLVQVTDVARKGVNRLQASSFDPSSSSASSSYHLSQSDGNSADTAGMDLWCMGMVQSRMWLARASME